MATCVRQMVRRNFLPTATAIERYWFATEQNWIVSRKWTLQQRAWTLQFAGNWPTRGKSSSPARVHSAWLPCQKTRIQRVLANQWKSRDLSRFAMPLRTFNSNSKSNLHTLCSKLRNIRYFYFSLDSMEFIIRSAETPFQIFTACLKNL